MNQMAKTKTEIMKELKNGLSCTRLDDKECKIVEGIVFNDKNGVRRACDATPVPLSSKKWCRDRLVIF